jgi:hypothetical protein
MSFPELRREQFNYLEYAHTRCHYTNSPSRNCEYIVELEGFRDCNNELVIKELTILNFTLKTVNTYLFKCPISSKWKNLSSEIRKTNQYVIEHIHGIPYQSGDIAYEKLHDILIKNTAHSFFIYSNGPEKCQFLSKIIGKEVIDLGKSILPRLKREDVAVPNGEHFYSCGNHTRFDPHYSCSLTKAFRFAECLRLYYVKLMKIDPPNKREECAVTEGREYLQGGCSNSIQEYEKYCKGYDEVDTRMQNTPSGLPLQLQNSCFIKDK